jgi:SAM-dependent methyltransferase
MGKLWHFARLAASGGATGSAYRVIRWHCPAGDLGLGLTVAVFAGTGWQGAVVDPDRAERWISRWDAQQEWYMPDREERFTVLIDAVEAGVGRDDPLVLDLGCGPGSLAVRLLDRMPAARVVAVDTDPLLLALGRAAYGGRSGLRFADRDLREPGWAGALSLDRAADAAVSTTALHWLDGAQLRAMYAELAAVLGPGGLMLDGDHLKEDEAAVPALARLGDAVSERAAHRRLAGREHQEDWKAWWEAATAAPELAGPAAERAQLRLSEDHHGSESVLLIEHVAALRAAGFAEIGTLWQYGENRILCAVTPS